MFKITNNDQENLVIIEAKGKIIVSDGLMTLHGPSIGQHFAFDELSTAKNS